LDLSRRRLKAQVSTGYTRFREGDILVPKITPTFQADRTVIVVGLEGGVGAGTTELHIVRGGAASDRRYIRYLLSSKPFLDEGEASMLGVAGQKRVPESCLRDLPVPVCDVAVQCGIADYLDTETAQIDALIEKKRRLIELLVEEGKRKQSDLAVGHGTGRSRSSGHEWLGDVPEDWSVVRLKFYAKLESGHTPSRTRPELWQNCDTPWVTLNDLGFLENHEYIDQTVNLISAEGLASSSARLLPAGTVILSRDATIGRSGILARPMATSQHFADWICSDQLRPRYLWLLLQTVVQRHLQSLTDGATLRTIGMPDIKELVIPLPPVEVQDSIVIKASIVREAVERTVDRLHTQLALLVVHRQALITAAVAGELEIPGVAA
jgi:type I restriction enzyme S subunit